MGWEAARCGVCGGRGLMRSWVGDEISGLSTAVIRVGVAVRSSAYCVRACVWEGCREMVQCVGES